MHSPRLERRGEGHQLTQQVASGGREAVKWRESMTENLAVSGSMRGNDLTINVLGQDQRGGSLEQLPKGTEGSADQRQLKEMGIAEGLSETGNHRRAGHPRSGCVLRSHWPRVICALSLSHHENISSLRVGSVLILFTSVASYWCRVGTQ